MAGNRYIIDVTGEFEIHDGSTKPVIVYRTSNGQQISQFQAYDQLGINQIGNVVIFIHGFNFNYSYANKVFNKIVDKICVNKFTDNTKFICIRWNSSANDTNNNVIGRLYTFIGSLFSGAVGEEIQKTGNSGVIYNRYVEDLERVAASFRGISWLVNDLAKFGKRINLIGHSMGCQAVINCLSFMCHDNSVLTSAYYGNNKNTKVSDAIVGNIDNVFLIAPDVNISIFKLFIGSNMEKLVNLSNFIIYSNNGDIAIFVSKLIRVHNQRLGNTEDAENSINNILNEVGGLRHIRDCVEKIDVLNLKISLWHDVIFAIPRAFTSRDYPFSHNYYTNDNICHDIGQVIFGGMRNNVKHHRIVNNNYHAGFIES